MAITTPFSSHELIPQEERLLVQKSKSSLFIGVPKEDIKNEKRICLTPESVHTLASYGHRVLIESGAGEASNYSDLEYSKAGAEITKDTKKVFSCPMIIKVVPPTFEQIEWMIPGSCLWSTIQIKSRCKAYFEALSNKKITALAFDFMKDKNGSLPAVHALSEIAGTSSVLIAAELMTSLKNGKGLLFGNITGVPPTEVVIIGAGIVAEFAARAAIGLGANVKVFDNSIEKLKRLQNNLPYRIFTSTIQEKLLQKALMRCDVAIGAIRGKHRSPIVVSEAMVDHMKQGAIIMDVCIDTGGCFETSEITTHENPIVIKSGVVHYGVPNITSRYSKTASMSISNIITPFIIDFAESGTLEQAITYESIIRSGIYVYKGLITHKSVADWYDLEYKDIGLFMF